MRIFILFCFFLISLSTIFGQATIEVSIQDDSTLKPIIFGIVALYKDGLLIAGEETNIDGKATFQNVPFGEYSIEGSYVGYQVKSVGVKVSEAKSYDILIAMKEGTVLDEIVVKNYKAPLITMDHTTSGATITSEMMATSSFKKKSMMATDSYTSVKGNASFTESAGQITAAEWNDLHNWQDWQDLLEEENYKHMTEYWGITPKERYSVLVLNDEQIPLSGAKVQLISNSSEVTWQAVTDHTGKAELWANAWTTEEVPTAIKVNHQGKKETHTNLLSIDQGTNQISMSSACNEIKGLDIVFTVDATGSMGDEIRFLKAELLDVISRVKDSESDLDIRTGAVFYRDVSDDYLTKESPLTSETEKTVAFVKEQSAGGGGDFPEAVHTALEQSLNLKWRADAYKLNFLILDAPPHEDEETMNSIKKQVKTAAEQGIRLIPITASGINRETEFLMKFMAVLTNGTYTFITDDSGIGNPHLDPVVKDYDVEKLNDLMVRIITQFTKGSACEVPYRVSESGSDINIFPNPATDYINIETNYTPEKITLTSSSGMVVKSINPTENTSRLDLADLVSGVYNANVYKGQKVESRSVLVVR